MRLFFSLKQTITDFGSLPVGAVGSWQSEKAVCKKQLAVGKKQLAKGRRRKAEGSWQIARWHKSARG